MLIVGIIGSVITFISTTILFFKCNVIEIVKDLTGIKIVKKKEVTLSGVTDTSLTKIKTSISRSTSTSKVKSGNEEEKIKNKGIIKETKSNDRYKSIETEILETKETELLDGETDLLEEETNILEEEKGLLEEETNILDEETGLLEEETNILDEETGLFEEETDLLEEVLKDGEYVKEIDVVVVNYTSIIDI
jgi:hypothetical protein